MIFDPMALLLLIGLGAGVLYTLVIIYANGGAVLVEQNTPLLIAEIAAVSLIILIAAVRLLWKIRRMF